MEYIYVELSTSYIHFISHIDAIVTSLIKHMQSEIDGW